MRLSVIPSLLLVAAVAMSVSVSAQCDPTVCANPGAFQTVFAPSFPAKARAGAGADSVSYSFSNYTMVTTIPSIPTFIDSTIAMTAYSTFIANMTFPDENLYTVNMTSIFRLANGLGGGQWIINANVDVVNAVTGEPYGSITGGDTPIAPNTPVIMGTYNILDEDNPNNWLPGLVVQIGPNAPDTPPSQMVTLITGYVPDIVDSGYYAVLGMVVERVGPHPTPIHQMNCQVLPDQGLQFTQIQLFSQAEEIELNMVSLPPPPQALPCSMATQIENAQEFVALSWTNSSRSSRNSSRVKQPRVRRRDHHRS